MGSLIVVNNKSSIFGSLIDKVKGLRDIDFSKNPYAEFDLADIPFIGKRYQQKKQAAVDIDIAKQAQQAALETQDPFLKKQLERELVAKQALLNTQGQLAQQITKMTGMMSLYDRAMSEQGSTRRARIQYDPRYKAILDPSSL